MFSTPFARLAAVAAVAIVLVGGAIAVSASSGSNPKPKTSHLNASAADLSGIPEKNGVLGSASAKTTVTEFLDPQCPICAAASKQILPSLIANHVRTGQVKLEARVLQFIGPDSATLARYADGAKAQNKLWSFLETLYANQGEENSGYVTKAYMTAIATKAGVDPTQAAKVAASTAADTALNEANSEAKQFNVTGTPTFMVTKNGKSKIVATDQLEAAL